MDIKFFTESLQEICLHSLVSVDRILNCSVIFNPSAGGFTILSRQKSNTSILNEYRKKALENPPRAMYREVSSFPTTGKGSSKEIACSIIKDAENEPEPFFAASQVL